MRKEMNCPKLLRSLNWILIFIFVEVAGICNADVAVAPGVGVQLPSDTNRISFVCISCDTAATNAAFTLYAPEPMPIDLFARNRLDDSGWSLCGVFNAFYPFTDVTVPSSASSRFFVAARGDVDSDSDGIPDGREAFLYHTSPALWDTSGDGLSDGVKVAQGLNPLLRDTDGDGFEDDEELASGSDPTAFTSGASATIRYAYDDDDRLTATYSGAGQGAAKVALTPAGNPATLHERSALN